MTHVEDDYTRAPIRKAASDDINRMPSMAELVKHYAAKLTSVPPAPRDTSLGAIVIKRISKYG